MPREGVAGELNLEAVAVELVKRVVYAIDGLLVERTAASEGDIDKRDPGVLRGGKPMVGRCRLQTSCASAVNAAPRGCYLEDLGSRLAQAFEGRHDPDRRRCEVAIVDVQYHVAVDAVLDVQAAVP